MPRDNIKRERERDRTFYDIVRTKEKLRLNDQKATKGRPMK